MKIQIPFRNGKEPLTYEADSIAEAVRQAIENKDELRYANLSNANLSRADLSNANLSYANLRYADLSGANLHHADLSSADLTSADLTGAYLEDANLQRASLIGAKVQGKTLWGKRPFLSLGACGSVGRTTLAFFFEDGSEPFIMCGCFEGDIVAFEARIAKEHSGTFHEVEYKAMVNYIKALYKEQQENK